MNLCLCWQNFGPYHFSRLSALQEWCSLQGHTATGLEVSDLTSTYAWRRDGAEQSRIKTLFPARIAEKVPATKVYQEARKFFRQSKFDVVFTPSYWPPYSILTALAARFERSAVVMMNESHSATGDNSVLKLAIKRTLCRLHDAAFVGGHVQREFHRTLGFSDNRIFEGYDAVDNAYFGDSAIAARADPDRTRARYGLPERYILSIGRFVEKKNLETLIYAYALAKSAGGLWGCDLVFVGGGPLKEGLLRLARGLGLPVHDVDSSPPVSDGALGYESVRFFPFAQLPDLPSYYALAECFVLPSSLEEWGLVVNEAMASGCPVIVSRAAGCASDLVVTGCTGYTFDPSSATELAQKLQQMLSSSEKCRVMGDQARLHMKDWSCERFARSALQAAEAALQPRTHSPVSNLSPKS